MNKKKDKDLAVSVKETDGKVNVVAQELKFAKLLACNDQKIRNDILKSLKKWLKTRSQSSYRKFKRPSVIFKDIHWDFSLFKKTNVFH